MSASMLKRFRVFCPYCKDAFEVSDGTTASMRPIIDRPCRNCGKTGVDAVEL